MEITTQDYTDQQKSLGAQVRKQRHAIGMTQDVLSEKCGIYRTYLSRIEGGTANPTLLVLGALADSLHVDLCDLFRE